MSQSFRFRYANEIAGTFMLVVLLVLLVVFFQAGNARKWFEPTRVVYVALPEEGSFGLQAGAEVRVLGTIAGTVERIRIDEHLSMRARVRVAGDLGRLIRIDSVAVIKKKFGVAGDAYLEITRGTGEELTEEVPTIIGIADKAPMETFEDVVDQIRNEFVPTITKFRDGTAEWGRLASDLRDTEGDFRNMLRSWEVVATELHEGEGLAASLLSDADMKDEVRQAVSEVRQSTELVHGMLTELRAATKDISLAATAVRQESEDLPGLVKNLQEVLAETKALTAGVSALAVEMTDVVAGVGDEVDTMPGLVLQTHETLSEIERLVEGIQRHWLVRGGMEERLPDTRIAPEDVVVVGVQP